MRRLLASALLTVPALAADPGPPTPDNPNWFPFPISVMESSKTAIDLSFLNEKPAGTSGYLKAEGEHIVDGKGKAVRLFGTNFCFGANFPEAADAEKVAAHLAKNGLNVVRLHHMDNDWGESLIVHEGQLDASGKIVTKLNEKNLVKLDKLVAELIKNGIYINLNLHVSRTYPGTPKGAPDYSKGLDYFHPPFIAAFKDYARQLLEHVNPHTGRAYKDEPGIAIIEMNNENTLVLNPWWMAKLEEPFAGELRALFVKHLQKKYPSIEKLREVWGLNDGSTGPNLIVNGDFTEGTKGWFLESNFGAKSRTGILPVASAAGVPPSLFETGRMPVPPIRPRAIIAAWKAVFSVQSAQQCHATNASARAAGECLNSPSARCICTSAAAINAAS